MDKVIVLDRPAAVSDRKKIGLGRRTSSDLRFEEQLLFPHLVLFLPHLHDMRTACLQHDKGTIKQNHICGKISKKPSTDEYLDAKERPARAAEKSIPSYVINDSDAQSLIRFSFRLQRLKTSEEGASR